MKYVAYILLTVGFVLLYYSLALIGAIIIIVSTDNIAFKWITPQNACIGFFGLVFACAFMILVKAIHDTYEESKNRT